MLENSFSISTHAETRMQQRGVRFATLTLILNAYDTETQLPGGLVEISLSSRALRILRSQGMPAREIERVDGIFARVALAGSTVVTVLRRDNKKRSKGNRHHRGRRPRTRRCGRIGPKITPH